MDSWQLRVLGTPHLHRAGQPPVPLERKPAAILAYLALEGPTPRSRLAGLLWPDGSDASARNNLRQALFTLRRFEGLFSGSDPLGLGPGVESDVTELQSRITSGQGQGLEWQGQLLEGYDYGDCPELEEWLLHERERLQELRREGLGLLCEGLEREGKLSEALSWAQKLLEVDPISEASHRRAMRLHYLLGDRAAALRAYRRCAEVLQRELGVRPLEETRALAQEIERGVHALPSSVRRQIPLAVVRPPRLVGREREWALMEDAWERGQVIVVSGEPGSGRSRLMLDFAASKGNFLLLEGRPGDRDVPYATHARTYRQTLEAYPDLDLPPWVRRELARMIPELGEAPGPITSESEKLHFYEAKAEVLRRIAARAPLILLTDDLQFVDPASLEAGQYVYSAFWGRPESPVRSILGFRTDELSPELQQRLEAMVGSGVAVHVELQPLRQDDIDALLTSLELPHPQHLAADLRRYTGGNPLFVLETLKHLLETDQLQGGLPQRLPPPGKVGPLIQRRLEGLSTEALQLARLMAVAGTDFSLELAARVMEKDWVSLIPFWEELEKAQLARGERFGHDLIYESVLSGTPAGIKTLLHRRAAQQLEAQKASPARVARHWLEGGEPERAAPFLLEAAQQARASLRLAEAADFYGRAADVLQGTGDLGTAFEARFAQARQLIDLEAGARAEEALAGLSAMARTARQKAQASLIHCHLLFAYGRFEELGAVVEEGLAHAVTAHDLRLEADLLEARASISFTLGNARDAMPSLERMVEIYRRVEDPLGLATAMVGLGAVRRVEDRPGALALFEESLRIAVRAGLKQEQVSALNNIARTHYELGQGPEALRYFGEAADLMADTGGAVDIRLVSLNGRAYSLRGLGRYAEALEAVRQGLELGEGTQFGWLGMLHLNRALTLQALGDLEAARAALRTVVEWPGFPSYNRYQVLLAQAELALGDPPGLLAEAGQRIEAGSDGFDRHQLELVRARLQPPQQALETTRHALPWVQQQGLRGLEIGLWVRQAQALLALGRPQEALEASQQALDLSQRYSPFLYRPEVWLTHHRSLEALGHPEATHWLEHALRWVLEAAEKHVPPEYRLGFLRHNPTNRELLQRARSRGLSLGHGFADLIGLEG